MKPNDEELHKPWTNNFHITKNVDFVFHSCFLHHHFSPFSLSLTLLASLIFGLSAAKQYEIKLLLFFLSRHKHALWIPISHTHTHIHAKLNVDSHVKCVCDLFLPHFACPASIHLPTFATTFLHTHLKPVCVLEIDRWN